MSESTYRRLVILAAMAAMLAVLFARWYQAGAQSAAYERRGVHITRWEILWGIRPSERTINSRSNQ